MINTFLLTGLNLIWRDKMYYLIGLGVLILALILVSRKSKFFLHMVQVAEYNTDNYKKWVRDNKETAYKLGKNREEGEGSLVFTDRARRLYRINLALNGLLSILSLLPYILLGKIIYLIISLVLIFLIYRQQADIIGYANIIALPIEERIDMGFYLSAQEKIKAREDLKVIGITGSYGKTSTKFILASILEEKFKVLNSPESCNTAKGLAKVINNKLDNHHEVFIAEMSARERDEIKEVVDLCQPEIGLITSIGPVHLEIFGNLDNIGKAKYELIEELPADGVAIFNYDSEHIKKLSDKTFKEKRLYGLEDIENLDLYAEDIVVSESGSSFLLKDKEGNSVECTSKLLGKHNIYNILAGASVARELGLSLEEISRGISKIEPIAHRLNIIDSDSGLIIIDDGSASNPEASKAALEVINQFKEARKIIVTPGLTELGDIEEEVNREFGNKIARVCDYVILIGKERTEAIYQGLVELNYDEDHIFLVETPEEGAEEINRIARPKDVVLFENELPDNYQI